MTTQIGNNNQSTISQQQQYPLNQQYQSTISQYQTYNSNIVNNSTIQNNPNNNQRYLGSVTHNYGEINQNLSNMRVSHLYQHNAYQDTDKLYQPLRDVILHPQSTVYKHQGYIPQGARVSHVSHQYHKLSQQEITRLKNDTWIPADAHLVPTDHFEKVKNSRFMVVDAQERIIGQPVSQRQVQIIRRRGPTQSRVVYDFGGQLRTDLYGSYHPPKIQQQQKQVKVERKEEVIVRPRQTINQIVQQRPPKYRTTPVLDIEQKVDYKYNLYSVIDQPMNKLREGNSCTCPGNQIIAKRNQPQSISWIK